MLGLRFCARAFSSCGERGPLFVAVRGPLTVTASLVAEHRLQTRRLSSRGSRAQLLCGMWDLPRPGLDPMSPALAGRFSTTAPPGKPQAYSLFITSQNPHSGRCSEKINHSLCTQHQLPFYSSYVYFVYQKNLLDLGTSLVAQWLRIRLPMQGTRVRALVWEDPTCRGAAGPVSHNY